METVFILTACLLPCLLYMSAGIFIIVKKRSGEDKICEAGQKVLRDLAVLVFLIALSYLSEGVYALCAADADFGSVADHAVMKLYAVSSVIPCILVKRYAYGKVCGQCFYIPVGLVLVLLLVADMMLYSGHWDISGSIIRRFSVLVVFAVFCYVAYMSSAFGSALLHDGKSRLGRELHIYLFIMSFCNFLILAYSFSIHKVFDYFIVVTGFAVIHSLLMIVFINGRTLSSFFVRNSCGDEKTAGRTLRKDGKRDFLDDTALSLKERLIGYFECEKPYLSKSINMQEVAMRLFTNKSYLSKTINMEMNKNFRELVNYFRVREAIKIYSANTGMSMSELMDKSGFNNNASFTSAFKLNTGYTPGEWCRDLKSRVTYEGERRNSDERKTQQ